MDTEPSWTTRLVDWYGAHQRDLPWRRTADPWAILVSEIMLQQTRVETVIPYYSRFLARFPDFATMAAAPVDEVLALWSGLGYYRRARSLHACAVRLQELGEFPAVESLTDLPGVGHYTAAALTSIAWGRPALALDGNAVRVLTRLYAIAEDAQSTRVQADLRRRTDSLIPADGAADFTQALMELGATVCLPRNPDCPTCPLRSHCQAQIDGHPESYPAAKPPARKETMTLRAFLMTEGERIWLTQEHGLPFLVGLWLPPLNLPGGLGMSMGSVRHQVTFRRITVEVFRLDPAEAGWAGPDQWMAPGWAGPGQWIARADLKERAIPSLTRKILQLGWPPPESETPAGTPAGASLRPEGESLALAGLQ